MSKSFDDLLNRLSQVEKKKVSVAVAQDDEVLLAVKAAKERGIADSILVGDVDLIKPIANEIGMNLDDYEVVDVKDKIEAAREAVKLVHDGKADMYMKGLIDTKDFLRSVLDKEVGLRSGRPLSHVCVHEIEGVDHLLFVTDVAFVPYPSLEDKANIIKNTVEICNACGIDNPKVAPLAAVEVVNPKMPETVEADELRQMNERGEITGCIVDGPLSLDLATCPEAAQHKGATGRKIVGDADVLLCPDIQAGNILYKCLVHFVKGKNGNLITGTAAPVILTSRSDSFEVKVNSLALGALVADSLKKNK
ncbi:phosphate butyryltransferase [Lachnospiraceae bacterium NE2001]|nr:phosphate butyryltransferase [Lachnospiraceae bacterium NE2001]